MAYGKIVTFKEKMTQRDESSVTDGQISRSDDQNCPSLGPGSNSSIRMDLGHIYFVNNIIVHLQGTDQSAYAVEEIQLI